MFLLLQFILLTSSLEFNPIPSTFSPPNMLIKFSAVFDQIGNQIIAIGGLDPKTFKSINSVISFNLTTRQYKTIMHLTKSSYDEISGNQLFARRDGKILSLGYFSGCISFDPRNYQWMAEELFGENFPPVIDFASVLFERDSIQYVAIFGGLLDGLYSNDLYL